MSRVVSSVLAPLTQSRFRRPAQPRAFAYLTGVGS